MTTVGTSTLQYEQAHRSGWFQNSDGKKGLLYYTGWDATCAALQCSGTYSRFSSASDMMRSAKQCNLVAEADPRQIQGSTIALAAALAASTGVSQIHTIGGRTEDLQQRSCTKPLVRVRLARISRHEEAGYMLQL